MPGSLEAWHLTKMRWRVLGGTSEGISVRVLWYARDMIYNYVLRNEVTLPRCLKAQANLDSSKFQEIMASGPGAPEGDKGEAGFTECQVAMRILLEAKNVYLGPLPLIVSTDPGSILFGSSFHKR